MKDFLSVHLGETPKQKPLHYITGYGFYFNFNQNSSLQQYAETPKQKHAGGFKERTSKSKRTKFNRKV